MKSSNETLVVFAGATTLAFTILRATGTTDWAWWWVLSPLWIVASAVIAYNILLGVWMALIGGDDLGG